VAHRPGRRRRKAEPGAASGGENQGLALPFEERRGFGNVNTRRFQAVNARHRGFEEREERESVATHSDLRSSVSVHPYRGESVTSEERGWGGMVSENRTGGWGGFFGVGTGVPEREGGTPCGGGERGPVSEDLERESRESPRPGRGGYPPGGPTPLPACGRGRAG